VLTFQKLHVSAYREKTITRLKHIAIRKNKKKGKSVPLEAQGAQRVPGS